VSNSNVTVEAGGGEGGGEMSEWGSEMGN